jgi:multidrug efflux pump subunit AcrA (membrane-fusion protein)
LFIPVTSKKLFRQAALDALSSPEQLEYSLKIPRSRPVFMFAGFAILLVGLLVWSFTGVIPHQIEAYGLLVQNPGYSRVVILAPSDGEIFELLVHPDDTVSVGQTVARLALVDDGSVIDVQSQYAGTVTRLNARKGEEVRANTSIIALKGDLMATSKAAMLEGVLYLPYADVQRIEAGMQSFIIPAGVSALENGYLKGRVVSIAQMPATDQFARGISPYEPVVAVRIALDMASDTHYTWTLGQPAALNLRAGMQVMGKILIREEQPIARVLRQLNDAR